MTDTHNALALANELDTKAQALGCPLDRFSAVLRLQHTRIADLEAQLYAIGAGGVGQSIKPQVQADAAQAQQKPVAWRVRPFNYGIGHEGVDALTTRKEQCEMWERKGWKVEPLYTAPQPTRQPLTDEQIWRHLNTTAMRAQSDAGYPSPKVLIELARVIEAAHGITGGQQ